MSGFYVDPKGLSGLYNLLHRASGDAADALDYTKRHCNLNLDQEGLLGIVLGPHRVAYGRMTQGLERLKTLTSSTATQINVAQLQYARSDEATAGRLDATYPGARDPSGLRSTVTSGRPDLWPSVSRSAFADVAEPAARLVAPNYATSVEMFQINPLTDLLSPAAWLRQVSVWVFGEDPFEGWAKTFSGDWHSYVHCAVAWGIIGEALDGVGRNLITGAGDVPEVWRGNAAEAEQEHQLDLGAAASALHPVCRQYADLYTQAAEAAKHLYAVVAALISELIDLLIVVNLAAAVGTAAIETGAGAVAGYSIAAYYAWQACELYDEISTCYSRAEAAFHGIAGAIELVKARNEVSALPDLKPYHHPGQ